MKRAFALLLCAFFFAGAGGRAATPPASTGAPCAAAKKALASHKRKMAAQRTSFFKSHKAPTARKAFLRRQRAKLKRLQKAAKRACQSACMRARGAVTDYKRLMAKERKAFFKRNKKPGGRRAFLRRQLARLRALEQLAAAACRVPDQSPQPPPPPPPPPPAPPAPPSDRDGDGTPDAEDCAPEDAAIHPGAQDEPDFAFAETNCDGIDGTAASAIFASPLGSDLNPGTRAAPKREIQAAVVTAAAAGKHVYAAGGAYGHLVLAGGSVEIYGGYAADTWARSFVTFTSIVGSPEGILLKDMTGVMLQLLAVHGNSSPSTSAYGIRVLNSSGVRLERVTVTAGTGSDGSPGANGAISSTNSGSRGNFGTTGLCDGDLYNGAPPGGTGGTSPAGRPGGKGGHGGEEDRDGGDGETALYGTPGDWGSGGQGGSYGNPGGDGSNGADGAPGGPGTRGPGGSSATDLAGVTWVGRSGLSGSVGQPGNGGGGGGGGGGQDCVFCLEGDGNGGGGGGGGARGGSPGLGGGYGHGSFGVYIFNSTVSAEKGSSIRAGNGGNGGRGGEGAAGGTGGVGGSPGQNLCPDEVGSGGFGGWGGNGGQGGAGGGGAGGPSISVIEVGPSEYTDDHTVPLHFGSGGAGGAGGTSGTGNPGIGARGINSPFWPLPF